jgi:ABC-2 type transport system ATP-binding protein|tara:strand:+ start:114847 stop:115524 length:678 start_codon:yes stop_codon:yes gene_type:complete
LYAKISFKNFNLCKVLSKVIGVETVFNCISISKNFFMTKVFRNLTFDIKKNSIFQVYGNNGTGKTTLLKILSGLDNDYEGTINYKNINLNNIETNFLKEVVFLPSLPSFYENLTVEENLRFLSNVYGLDKLDINSSFKLTQIKDKQVKDLSDGQRKKIQLSIGIQSDAEVLVMDEPYNFLDIESQNQISYIFIELVKKNKTIIFSDNTKDSYTFEVNNSVNLNNV